MEATSSEIANHPLVQRTVAQLWEGLLKQARVKGWRSVTSFVQRSIRENRALHSVHRREVADTLHELIRQFRRVQTICQQKQPNPLHLYAAWYLDKKKSGQDSFEWPTFFQKEINRIDLLQEAWLTQIERLQQQEQDVKNAEDPARALGECFSYPSWLVGLLLNQYGHDRTQRILVAQNQRAPLTIRANLLKTTRESLQTELESLGISSQSTPFSIWGLILQTRQNLYGLDLFEKGCFELQDEGSQLIADLVSPPPGGVVIDACAGAGGKTLALGAQMAGKGRLLALDIDDGKLQELRKRARRAGLTNVHAQLWTQALSPLQAQRVLCDVPCSGTGVFRRNPESRWALQKEDLPALMKEQKTILQRCASLVQPGGRLIYATCSILQEENEQQIQSFLQVNSDFVLMPTKEIWSTSRAHHIGDETYLRLLPNHPEGPDGFFAVSLRRR